MTNRLEHSRVRFKTGFMKFFQARVITGGAHWDLSLTLKQVNGENISELRFADPSGEGDENGNMDRRGW